MALPLYCWTSSVSTNDTVPQPGPSGRTFSKKNSSEYTMHFSEFTVPPEWGGGPQRRTIPWPRRTDTVLLVLVLKFSRSVGNKQKQKQMKSV